MNKTLIVIGTIVMLSGCGAEPPISQRSGPALGFDPEEFDVTVRPQDDFYSYVNGQWLSSTEIPPEWSSYGVMQILYEETEQQLRELVDEAVDRSQTSEGTDIQKIGDLYASFVDEPLAESLGIEPLETEFDRISQIQSHADVIRYMGHALAVAIQVPINFYIDANAADPKQNLAYIWQDGLGMPDRDYYLSDAENLVEVRRQYVLHIENMFALAGWPDGASAAEQIARLEGRIAEAHWSRVQNRDRERIYTNKFDIESATDLSPGFDWTSFLEIGGFGTPAVFVIAQTDYFSQLGTIIHDTPVAEWQNYFRFKALKSLAPYLNAEIVEEDFNFQRRVLRGQEEIRPRWKRGIRIVNGGLGEAVGRAYVERYFPPDSKQRLDALIENLRTAFRQSIDELDWMSAETKQAAQLKLDKFTSKIGFPDQWRDYTALEIEANDLVGNVRRSRIFEHNRQVAKLAKPVDRTEWGMTPQTINAYYRPTMNEIVFPAAILQAPFFDPNADDATNYGSIGAVIGHEFSHGFDDQGRKFDGDGRLMDWWTESDAAEYENRSAGLVAQYAEFEPLPGQNLNGELTLGENIADLAGLIMAYRAWRILEVRSETPEIDGFSGDQRFFIGYAQSWRAKQRPEYLTEMILSDSHSPPRYRVTGALRNMPAFYAAFGVTEGDAMYLPDDQRVKIW